MDLKKALEKIGFSKNEVKIILILKKYISLSAKEISTLTLIPRTKTYPILKKMIKKQHVIELNDKTSKHFALTNLQSISDELIDIANALSGAKEKTYTQAPVSVIRGKEEIINWLQDGVINLQKYSNSFTYLDRDFPDSTFRKFKRISNKGIKFRFITLYDKKNHQIYKKWLAAGVKVRFFHPEIHGHPMPRNSTMDDKLFRLTIGKPDVPTDDMFISFVGKNKTISLNLNKYFLNIWKKSQRAEEVIFEQSK